MLGTVIYAIPLFTLMTEKSCLYSFGYNESMCSNIEDFPKEIRNPVVAHATTISTYKTVVTSVPGESP